MRISRWDETSTVWRKQFPSDRDCLQRTCCAVCHEQTWYLLTRWENNASALVLALVFSHTMCLQNLGGHWRCFSLTPAAFSIISEAYVISLLAWWHIPLNPCSSSLRGCALKHRREVWAKQVLLGWGIVLEVMGCKSLNSSFSICPCP